ncbi:MAG: M36 family metallopeptidase [Saprospiraceae bacterium]
MFKTVLLIFVLSTNALYAQLDISQQARQYLISKIGQYNISNADIKNARVSDFHYDQKNNINFIYLQQTFSGVDIFNAVTAVGVRDDGLVINSGNGWITELENKNIISTQKYSAVEALYNTLEYLNVPIPKKRIKFQKQKKGFYTLALSAIAYNDLVAEKIYYPKEDKLILSWRIEYDSKFSGEITSTIIDAGTGNILEEIEQTLKCFYPSDVANAIDKYKNETIKTIQKEKRESSLSVKKGDGAQYLVYPYYTESPNHGPQVLLVDPSDEVASPFGWHDTNGREGQEHSFTKGNNGHAFQDRNGNNQSSNDEPSGGPNLIFNTPHSLSKPVTDTFNLIADVTQLFYMGNVMHDWSYNLGFDEASGNFQKSNYGKGGSNARSNDEIELHTLDGLETGSLDNANFSVTSDGNNGRMQMFVFQARSKDLIIENPESISGAYFTGSATFGPGRVNEDFVGNLVLMDDGSEDVTDGCESVINTDEINGNIALIRRGTCFFSSKMYNAQMAGAKAVLVCNNRAGGVVNMSGADNADDVTIPGYFISQEDCDPIEKALLEGEQVNMKFIQTDVINFSSGFDNGIVAHEYGHGISTRLTGGASRANCLDNDEEMGEGWSDFFSLVITQQEGDTREKLRGIGTFVRGTPPTFGGIRGEPYTTVFESNPKTLHDIRGTNAPHPLGEVWAATLWDIYWLYIDKYGYDFTWKDKNAGNHRAVRLVITGLKLQPCRPGFIEGRNAILAADQILFSGENRCMLWKAFAKRGIGFGAFGGKTTDRNDNIESFENLPECIKTVKINKRTPLVSDVDDVVEITVTAINHTDNTLRNTIIKNIIPENAEFVSTSTDFSPDFTNGVLTYNVGNMTSQQEVEMKYKIRMGTGRVTKRMIFDDFGPGNGFFSNLQPSKAKNEWTIQSQVKKRGTRAYNIINDTLSVGGSLTQSIPMLLNQEKPAFRFYHRFFTEYGFDGGILEISEDGGNNWTYIEKNKFLTEGYTVEMINNLFQSGTDVGKISAFTGNSNFWIESIIDLSAYRDKEVIMRFRWQSDESTGIDGTLSGWFVDYVDYLDLADVSGMSCLNADDTEEVCVTSVTVIDVKEGSTPNNNITKSEFAISVFPNPTNQNIHVRLTLEKKAIVNITLTDLNGKVISSKIETLHPGTHIQRLLSSYLPDGAYIIQVNLDGQLYNEKLIKITKR